jgi:hypothetical protein
MEVYYIAGSLPEASGRKFLGRSGRGIERPLWEATGTRSWYGAALLLSLSFLVDRGGEERGAAGGAAAVNDRDGGDKYDDQSEAQKAAPHRWWTRIFDIF